jgi:tetratricopeptide (TPR) repeat protein
LAYCRTYSVPLLFDDQGSISENPTIKHLATALTPPRGVTVSGRPILNLSLAANYALGGVSVWGYHAVNLGIHVLAGLTLFGILRRALERLGSRSALQVAFCATLLWTVHPLLTGSVTYIIQRAESLMGLWYLLTVYCFMRGAESGQSRGRAWFAGSIASCLLGMATKEVMVSAPLIVLLLDRAVIAGSFREAWRCRRRVYVGLASTWLILTMLVLSTNGRGGSAGLVAWVSPWSYALTQAQAIPHYLRLCFWPSGLTFDYGRTLASPSLRLLAPALAVLGLLAATVWALVRRPALGLLGASFFAILAPTSSFVPVATEPVAEHRMYLPLIPVILLAVIGIHRLLGRWALPCCLGLAGALTWATWQRNQVYLSEEALWRDTVASVPGNARALTNLGNVLASEPGRMDEAIARYDEAIRLMPGLAEAHYSLGNALIFTHRTGEAIVQYRAALGVTPNYAEARCNLGNALASQGHFGEAIAEYRDVLRLNPDFAEAHYNLGDALVESGEAPRAVAEFEAALRLDPGFTKAHYSLANALSSTGRAQDAIPHYEEAFRLKPDFAEAHYGLGIALNSLGRAREAIVQYGEAIRLRPGLAEAHFRLADTLGSLGLFSEAIPQYEEAIRARPRYAEAECNLGNALSSVGRNSEAVAHFDRAILLRPDFAEAQYDLGNALIALGRAPEAAARYEEAVRLRPDYTEARCNLGNALSSLGRDDLAIGQFEAALRAKPEDALIHFGLAVSLLKVNGRVDDAVAHLREVLRIQPGNARARQILERIEALRK